MRELKLTPPRLFFIVGTRAALGAGLGLLLSGKLSSKVRRSIGLGLVALGAVTTVPAVRTLAAAAR